MSKSEGNSKQGTARRHVFSYVEKCRLAFTVSEEGEVGSRVEMLGKRDSYGLVNGGRDARWNQLNSSRAGTYAGDRCMSKPAIEFKDRIRMGPISRGSMAPSICIVIDLHIETMKCLAYIVERR